MPPELLPLPRDRTAWGVLSSPQHREAVGVDFGQVQTRAPAHQSLGLLSHLSNVSLTSSKENRVQAGEPYQAAPILTTATDPGPNAERQGRNLQRTIQSRALYLDSPGSPGVKNLTACAGGMVPSLIQEASTLWGGGWGSN